MAEDRPRDTFDYADGATAALRRQIKRRKALDFSFAVLGLVLVVASLSVLVALFGSLLKDGGERLLARHEVKANGDAPGRRELVGTLKPGGQSGWVLERDTLRLNVLESAAESKEKHAAAAQRLETLKDKVVVIKADIPEPGVNELVAEMPEIAEAPASGVVFSRDAVSGTLRKQGRRWTVELLPLPLDMSRVQGEANSPDLSALSGKRVAVDHGIRASLPLRVSGIEPLQAKSFFKSTPSRNAFRAGILPAIVGSVLVVLVTMVVALPLGVAAGIYLEEYGRKNWFTALIEINIANLAGVPSIIWGLMGLALFVYWTGIGRNVYAAGLTLGLLVLPIVVMATREAIRAIPLSIREASYACGASKWQTTRFHIIPYSLGGILTGAIIGLSRAIGETAPLITVGAVLFMTSVPSFSKDSPFTVLPIQMFDWTSRPDRAFNNNAAAAGIVLLVLTLTMNAIAIVLRYRLRKSIKW